MDAHTRFTVLIFIREHLKDFTFCFGFINFTRQSFVSVRRTRSRLYLLDFPVMILAHSCTADFSPFYVLINSTVCNPPLITSLWIWRCQELFSCYVSELIFAVAKGDIVSELFLNIEMSSAEEHLHSSLISLKKKVKVSAFTSHDIIIIMTWFVREHFKYLHLLSSVF